MSGTRRPREHWLSDGAIDRLRATGAEVDLTNTRYRLVRPIGRGGMGMVYLVEDPALERRVALKVLDVPDRSGDLAARLVQEARVLARLEHPGIVPVYDVGQLGDGRVYYTMKYVRGDRLDHWAPKNPSRRERLGVFGRICEAVAFAHAHQVLHRDIKPQNVMVGSFGEVLVMDWGVAKILQSADEEVTLQIEPANQPEALESVSLRSPGVKPSTRHGSVLGTPGYMAPEQARGEIANLDQRSDVYALGAVLQFLLAAPGSERSLVEDDGRGKRVPAALASIARKAMHSEAGQRYDSAEDLGAEVTRYLEGRPVLAHPEGLMVRSGRFLWRHRVGVALLLVYAIVRAFVLLTQSG